VSRPASPIEKDAVTMPTQKVFKQRVRARMTKTGESYTAARRQLLQKAPTRLATAAEPAPVATDPAAPPTSDDAVRRATGHGYEHWFRLLDDWGGTERNHTQIASWVATEHKVDGWWAQSITVGYERARGMRAVHQRPGGFEVSASRTVRVDAETALAAFTEPAIRRRWLPGPAIRQRPTKAANVARFDWSDPPSRFVVSADPKGDRTTVYVAHEKLPDAAEAERQKAAWRQRLTALKSVLESD
jgi:hypothetical protein